MIIHLHRFHDKLAISLEGQPTVYLDRKMVEFLADALEEGLEDLEERAFVNSEFPTQTLETL